MGSIGGIGSKGLIHIASGETATILLPSNALISKDGSAGALGVPKVVATKSRTLGKAAMTDKGAAAPP